MWQEIADGLQELRTVSSRCTGRSHRAETGGMRPQARSAKDGWALPDTEEVRRLPQSESQPALPAP